MSCSRAVLQLPDRILRHGSSLIWPAHVVQISGELLNLEPPSQENTGESIGFGVAVPISGTNMDLHMMGSPFFGNSHQGSEASLWV